MLNEQRWWVEIKIMERRFPWFRPFETASGHVGFFGHLRGPRTGRLYEVVLKVPARVYPDVEPPIYMLPRLTNHWRQDTVNNDPSGRLCYKRDGTQWRPAKHTFANCVAFALEYLEDFNG